MNLLKRTAIALTLVGAAVAAQAATVTYDFSVFVLNGPQGGNSFSGWLSYDASTAAPSTTVNQTGLLTGFSFDFDGVLYDQSTANTGFLQFDAAGDLLDFAIGSSCTAGDNCTISAGSNGFSMNSGGFIYATSAGGYDGTYNGFVTDLTLRAGGGGGGGDLPEPASLALVLSAGLLAAANTRRRA